MYIDCPKCKINVNLDNEDLPQTASESTEVECRECYEGFSVGWYATAELR